MHNYNLGKRFVLRLKSSSMEELFYHYKSGKPIQTMPKVYVQG